MRQNKKKQDGFVIVAVLCIVMMLSVILFGFYSEARRNYRAAENIKKAEQSLNCARAGLNIAIAAVKNATDNGSSKIIEQMLSQTNNIDLPDGECSITMVDESGKLNVNLLKNENGRPDRNKIEQFIRLIENINKNSNDGIEISCDIVPSIIDWADKDDQTTSLTFIDHENSGAESDYYEHLRSPCACKNRPFETIQELLPVKGMTQKAYAKIKDHLTVYGNGKININSASEEVIESLSDKMDATMAELIIEQRKFEPFESVSDIRSVPGMTDEIFGEINRNITVNGKNEYYKIISQGSVDEYNRTIASVIRRNAKASSVEVVVYQEY